MKFVFELAKPEDDPALRALLASTPMPGRITVAFEREPNYFLGCTTLGASWQVIVARDASNQEIAGVMCRSVRQHYINGEPCDLGYIGQIRIAEKYRSLWLLQRGLAYFRELHAGDPVPAYWGAISVENDIARGVLVEKSREGFPKAFEAAHMYTLGIILRKPLQPLGFNGQIERGSETNLDEIVSFLQCCGAERQFFPVYQKSDFLMGEVLRGFNVRDFLIARHNHEIVGLIGLWDQSGYKQSIVRGYDRSLRVLRPLYNFGAKFLAVQPLPGLGGHIHSAYAGFTCVKNEDPLVFAALLRSLYNLAVERNYAYLMLGLPVNDPLLPSARRYLHISYHSRIYIGTWEGEMGFGKSVQDIDGRIPYFEIAAI